MKLLYILDNYYMPEKYGGIQSTIHDLTLMLQQQGIQGTILCQLKGRGLFGFMQKAKRALLRLDHCRDSSLGYPVIRAWNPLPFIRKIISDETPDMVVLQQSGRFWDFAKELSTIKQPFVIYYHDQSFLKNLKNAPIDPRKIPSIANSDFIASHLVEHGIVPEVLHPPVDSERLKERKDRRRKYVLFFNPREEKGLDISTGAAALLPDIPFVFVEGWDMPPKQRKDLGRLIKDLKNVQLLSSTPDVSNLFAGARLVIVPSLINEAWGRVVTEAQLCGVVVIARDVGGLPESVGSGGILMPKEAGIPEWSATIRSAWTDDQMRNELVAKGLSHANSDSISGQKIAQRFIRYLQDILSSAANDT